MVSDNSANYLAIEWLVVIAVNGFVIGTLPEKIRI